MQFIAKFMFWAMQKNFKRTKMMYEQKKPLWVEHLNVQKSGFFFGILKNKNSFD